MNPVHTDPRLARRSGPAIRLADMTTVVLIRHGRSTANADGVLAGRSKGVGLDATGREQARQMADRLTGLQLAGVITSPLKRCRQTAAAITGTTAPAADVEHGINECDYGHWQGRKLADLSGEPLWSTIQEHPSAAVFPGGESLRNMQFRAVSAIRARAAEFDASHGERAVWAAVSHGDVIKSILADALGTHLDHFQRLIVNPASVSVITYTASRPYVIAMNTHVGNLAWVGADTGSNTAAAGAQVGGGDVPDSTATGQA